MEQPKNFVSAHLFGTSITETLAPGSVGICVLEGIDIVVQTSAADTIKATAEFLAAFFWGDGAAVSTPDIKYMSWRGRLLFTDDPTVTISVSTFANADLSIFAWGRKIAIPYLDA